MAQPLPSGDVAPAARGVPEQQAEGPSGHTALPDTPIPAADPEPARYYGGAHPRKQERDWYGWQTLVADASAAILIGIGLEIRDGSGPALGGLLVYGLGGPIIHVVHERPGAALGSLGLRAGLPVIFAVAGIGANENCEGDFCGYSAAATFGAAGMVAAVVLDAAFLGTEKRGPPPRIIALTSVAPSVDPARRTAGVSFAGTF